MSELRKYTVAEIDLMREALRRAMPDGTYLESERSANIENRLRTHMQNGTSPDELVSAMYEALALRQRTENMFGHSDGVTNNWPPSGI